MAIITPEKAFQYAKKNYPSFPNDWFISPHFLWSEVFENEIKSYGCPPLNIFQTSLKSATEFEKIRNYLGKPMNTHCWFRSMQHNLDIKIKQHLNPAMHSSHLYAMALDFDVTGMTIEEARTKILEGVKKGILRVRVEPRTATWIHCDIGNPYINDYKWGLIKM
jgi:hypothetical protein